MQELAGFIETVIIAKNRVDPCLNEDCFIYQQNRGSPHFGNPCSNDCNIISSPAYMLDVPTSGRALIAFQGKLGILSPYSTPPFLRQMQGAAAARSLVPFMAVILESDG